MSTALPLATPMLDPPVAPSDHAAGPAGARVTLVEYADFECPSCGAAHDVIQAARRAFGDNLRLVFRHFPLRDSHPHALDAARAAEAAAEQGQFWPMHDRLFQRQHALEPEDLGRSPGRPGPAPRWMAAPSPGSIGPCRGRACGHIGRDPPARARAAAGTAGRASARTAPAPLRLPPPA
ncbi:MAG TPA: DsbA family protein, partial [Gemmatimonadales bacterium]|nr:DsbA family protein [Gemmatimonadales bacterium]